MVLNHSLPMICQVWPIIMKMVAKPHNAQNCWFCRGEDPSRLGERARWPIDGQFNGSNMASILHAFGSQGMILDHVVFRRLNLEIST